LEGILVLLFWLPKREQEPFRKCWLLIAAVGILLLISDRLYFEAMHQDGAMVSVVSLLRRTSVVVSFFGGIVFMKERKGKTKVLALVAVIAGIVLLLL
jgi:transporter family protein